MARKNANRCLTGGLGLAVVLVVLGLFSYDRHETVDTEAMLAVSVSIKTVSPGDHRGGNGDDVGYGMSSPRGRAPATLRRPGSRLSEPARR